MVEAIDTAKFRCQIGIVRDSATAVGMPTLASHGPAIDDGVAEDAFDAVDAGENGGGRHVVRVARGAAWRGRAADVLRGIEAAGHHHALRVGERHHRTRRQRDRGEHLLERFEVNGETQHADHRVVVHDRVASTMACTVSPALPSIGLTRIFPVRATCASQAGSTEPSTFGSGGSAQASGAPLASAMRALFNNWSRPPTSGSSTSRHGGGFEGAEARVPGGRRRHGIRGVEVAVHIDDDGGRHRAGLRGELTHVLLVGQARAVPNRSVGHDDQDQEDGERSAA